MNRAVLGLRLFEHDADYAAFERVLAEARRRVDMRICAYAIMPNHFHLVLWPREDDDLSAFMRWLTMTHVQRWHARRHDAGRGHLYQSRFKSFPVQRDGHFRKVCRYVERNPLRAGLVRRAENWPWGSLACRCGREHPPDLLSDWPASRPADWLARVNRPESRLELEAMRRCVARGRPFGDDAWTAKAAAAMGLESTLRPVGRPRLDKKEP
jgi:putative transposase